MHYTCTKKVTNSQLNILHGTKRKKSNEKLKNPRCSEETVSNKVRGVSPEAGMESMVGKVYERGRS